MNITDWTYMLLFGYILDTNTRKYKLSVVMKTKQEIRNDKEQIKLQNELDAVPKNEQGSQKNPKASSLVSSIFKAYSPTKKLTPEEIAAHNSFGFLESLRIGAHEIAPKLFNKPQGADHHSKEFFYLHNQLKKERELINHTIKKLKSSLIDPSNSKNSAKLYTKLNQEILNYQNTKHKVHGLYKNYDSLNLNEKETYWKKITGYEGVSQTVKLFEKMNQLLQSPQGERFDTLDVDFFLAFHNEQGQALIAEFLMGIERYKVDFMVKHGCRIQIEPAPKDGFHFSDISAKTDWKYTNIENWGDLSIDEFFLQLQQQMIPGSPEYLGNITLVYAQEGSVPFGYTADKDGSAQSYLIETYVTFLHELGHAAALLRGDYFDYDAPFPKKLGHYHELEEFLNIRFRTINEASLDPLGIQRVGHTGIEFESLSSMRLSLLTTLWGNKSHRETTQEQIDADRDAHTQLKESKITWAPPKPEVEKKHMQRAEQKHEIMQTTNSTTTYRNIISELTRKNKFENESQLDNFPSTI